MDMFSRSGFVGMVSFVLLGVLPASGLTLSECKDGAAAGDPEAMWELGLRYEQGDGVSKNPIRALAQYKKAAEKHHRKACERLAELYGTGTIVSRDSALEAKYRALARGQDGEAVASKVRAEGAAANSDEINVALDYLLGRNGKTKDPRTGIRVLFAAAKGRPFAQHVFVDRWCSGDLDDALSEISAEEWEQLLPWFSEALSRGVTKAAFILGNAAYRKKEYGKAISLWEKSGIPKGYYFIGRFYTPWKTEEDGGGPESWKNEGKARRAYEKCLRLDSSWDDARFELGLIYLYSDRAENRDFAKAFDVFSYFIKKNPDKDWALCNYGIAGCRLVNEEFARLYSTYKRNVYKRDGQVYDDNSPAMKARMKRVYDQVRKDEKKYVEFIRRAAELGSSTAEKFLETYKEYE